MPERKKCRVWAENFDQFQKRKRNPKEEILYQEIEKSRQEYWSGVKLAKIGIYGAFQLHAGEKKTSQAAFLLEEEEFLFITTEDERKIFQEIKEKIVSKTPNEAVELVFDTLLKSGMDVGEEMENYLIFLEREIVGGRIDRNRNQTIFECKRTLILWKNDCIQLLNIAEGMNGLEQKKPDQQGKLLLESYACYFWDYENKVKHLTEQIQFLYEELLHIREALDAAIAYDQNRIMKVFTAVTTIFMPLTLIVGWYGMNFTTMAELTWKYGYFFVIVLSIIVILICLMFFKKKKLF